MFIEGTMAFISKTSKIILNNHFQEYFCQKARAPEFFARIVWHAC